MVPQNIELSGPASSSGCLYGQKRQEQVEQVNNDINISLLCKILFKLVWKSYSFSEFLYMLDHFIFSQNTLPR